MLAILVRDVHLLFYIVVLLLMNISLSQDLLAALAGPQLDKGLFMSVLKSIVYVN